MHPIATALGTAAVLVSTVSSCGGSDNGQTVLVLAASSLTDAFGVMEEEFEAAHPDLDVEVSLGGSTTLQVQLEQGAPADVVAFADTASMETLAATGLVDPPQNFASNSMILATPADNPGVVGSVDDLADPSLLVGVCAPQVPCGAYAREVLAQAGVVASIDTEEPDVRSLASKLARGDLDAGLIYTTDIGSFEGDIAAVQLPAGVDVRAEYPIAVVDESSRRADATRFVEFVLSPAGQQILAEAGFGAA